MAGVPSDGGDLMTAPVTVSERDLSILTGIVSDDRPDLPAGDGLPPSLLADLTDQIRCDAVSFSGFDSTRERLWFRQDNPALPFLGSAAWHEGTRLHWQHYWGCQPCSYPDRTGDLRSVVTIADFYSARQWRSTGMYSDCYRPLGDEHALQLTLPAPGGPGAGPGRTVRLYLIRGPGADFSERDRALLVLLRPHLHQAYLDAERRRHPVPPLTARHWDLLRLLAAGHTNAQIARGLGITEGTVRTHLQTIYDRLDVTSRTAAVARAFPGQVP
jgi:DNA-binding CsgD family transcriptional regulator